MLVDLEYEELDAVLFGLEIFFGLVNTFPLNFGEIDEDDLAGHFKSAFDKIDEALYQLQVSKGEIPNPAESQEVIEVQNYEDVTDQLYP